VGETEACGTAMVAVAAIVSKMKPNSSGMTISVPGGDATVSVDEDGYSVICGPAEFSFEGICELSEHL
jgi:diaminopimelate epimerase